MQAILSGIWLDYTMFIEIYWTIYGGFLIILLVF